VEAGRPRHVEQASVAPYLCRVALRFQFLLHEAFTREQYSNRFAAGTAASTENHCVDHKRLTMQAEIAIQTAIS
jgi:hypothetical protein